MADDSADIFVKFVHKGRPIPSESTTSVGNAPLFTGFKPGSMFEIDSFTFAVGVEDDSESKNKTDDPVTRDRSMGGAGRTVATAPAATRNGGTKPSNRLGGYQAFRSGRGGVKYPVSVQPITITRPIDKSSPRLLQFCIDTTSFDSVSVVKRKAAGTLQAGEPYLRLDFVGVLIQDISWSNDQPVKETTKLISRAITVRYRPQLPNGDLGVPKIGFWNMFGNAESPLQ